MIYDNLLSSFFSQVPECLEYFYKRKAENLIDENSGAHIIFGLILVPFILEQHYNGHVRLLKQIFRFLEKMAVSDDPKVVEVLDFTVLEQLADEENVVLSDLKKYMGPATLQHLASIMQYFM